MGDPVRWIVLHRPDDQEGTKLTASISATVRPAGRGSERTGRGREALDTHRSSIRAHEADFLLHQAGRFRLADAEWSPHPASRDAEGLRQVARRLPAGAARHLALFCRSPHAYPLGQDVRALPLVEASGWLDL